MSGEEVVLPPGAGNAVDARRLDQTRPLVVSSASAHAFQHRHDDQVQGWRMDTEVADERERPENYVAAVDEAGIAVDIHAEA